LPRDGMRRKSWHLPLVLFAAHAELAADGALQEGAAGKPGHLADRRGNNDGNEIFGVCSARVYRKTVDQDLRGRHAEAAGGEVGADFGADVAVRLALDDTGTAAAPRRLGQLVLDHVAAAQLDHAENNQEQDRRDNRELDGRGAATYGRLAAAGGKKHG